MSRRPQRDLELVPHHVYKHFNTGEALIYVGMTSDPKGRPTDTKRRPWIKTESARIEVSPPMSYLAATWVERTLIREAHPKHNERGGCPIPEERDWRIDRICEVEGITRTAARRWVAYFPQEEVAFEALLESRRIAALEPPSAAKAVAVASGEVSPESESYFADIFGPLAQAPTDWGRKTRRPIAATS